VAEDTRTHTFLGVAAYNTVRRRALGPMGVLPQAHGTGLGTILLKRCLRDLRSDGYLTEEIFSVGPIPFYARTVNARIFYQYAKPFAEDAPRLSRNGLYEVTRPR